MGQYVSWAEGSSIPYRGDGSSYGEYAPYVARFYDCSECQQAYRDHIQTVVERVNSVSGVVYRDDPAVFSWELANEPRVYPAGWPNDTAGYIKSLDSNHLVTVGSEGHWAEDYTHTHQGENIDYGTVHVWAENSGVYDSDDASPENLQAAIDFAVAKLAESESRASQLNKPIVFEEFGLARDGWTAGGKFDPTASVNNRDAYFAEVFAWVENNLATGGAMAGDNFWAWGGEARPPSAWTGDPPHEPPGWYSVYDADSSTLDLIATHAARVEQ
jgi:mannan endo-1,4-beta-mannosidase